MNDDLRQYAGIIEQLKPHVASPDFSKRISDLTPGLPNERRFLIKMEVKRLARPCVRSIDLRGHVQGECRLYEFGGIKHYLDDIAIKAFEKQVALYGTFTFGVYEAVMETENNYRVMRDKAGEAAAAKPTANQAMPIEKYSVPVVNLLSYARRQHERMNFAVTVEVITYHQQSWRGNSVDISAEGLQIKLSPDARISTGEVIEIFFRGLEEEFSMDKKQGIVYEVLKTVFKNDHQYLMLKRHSENTDTPFDAFLENFIHGNKRRYKVNMSNTIDAIFNKTVEQFLSPRSPSVPVFIGIEEGKLVPRYAMTNEVNTDILDYWTNEADTLQLGYLVNQQRLNKLVKLPKGDRELYVFSFTHLQYDKVYFYSASTIELDEKDLLKRVFLGFGSRKASWRVFKLTMTDMSPEQAHSPLSIPDSVSSKIKKQNQAPSARLMARLKSLRFIVHITDITSDSGQRHYSEYTYDRSNLSHLKIFGHARNRPPASITTYRYRYHDQRMEKRYLLRSQLVMTSLNGEHSWQGVSEDISVRGLRIELTREFDRETDTIVEVGFPKLQELTEQYDVMKLRYRVVYYNEDKNILHLKACDGETGKVARQFFDNLIKQNKDALKAYPEEEDIAGIGHALRCINARNIPSLAFVMGKEGIRYLPQSAVISQRDESINQVAAHFAPRHQLNFEFMFRDRNLEAPFIQHGIKQIKLEQLPLRQELYIAYDPAKKQSKMAVMPRFDTRFSTDEARLNFINDAMGRGQFIALHVLLTTTGKPDMDMLQAEMNYVSMYAIHRARELEARIWNIVACAHLVDITDEVLGRYNIEPAQVKANRRFGRPAQPGNNAPA